MSFRSPKCIGILILHYRDNTSRNLLLRESLKMPLSLSSLLLLFVIIIIDMENVRPPILSLKTRYPGVLRQFAVTSDLRSCFPRAGNSLGQSLGFERWATARITTPKIMLTSPSETNERSSPCPAPP